MIVSERACFLKSVKILLLQIFCFHVFLKWKPLRNVQKCVKLVDIKIPLLWTNIFLAKLACNGRQ